MGQGRAAGTGGLRELRRRPGGAHTHLPGYAGLREACAECGAELTEAPMGITGMVNVGEGAVTLGRAAEEHAAEF